MLRQLEDQFDDFKADIEDQLNDYMLLEEADTFVETIVNDKTEILRAHLLKKAYEKYEKIDATIEDLHEMLSEQIVKKSETLDKKIREKTKA